ncbi:hypothetical protein [Paenibacillus sp. MMS18-CY102]|uniref:hypothetical protein n=1 Tax=Paenibacillus sp. MMS18-CY102 TaxID=2682849 RepID=UPI00136663DF|nr:hypothetical protein [Paenibacillus sp. MMS18-CY102]MWC29637.1 hypothetical protein [Paenibacillus sp. MMS18-CY102]
MPDWSYQTLFRPVLFRMPARAARGVTLRGMGNVSRIPGGTFVIKALGHMEPAPMLNSHRFGTMLPTPVGLSGAIDQRGIAVQALSQLGFGFVEVGPVTLEPIVNSEPIEMNVQEESITYPCEYENGGAQETLRRIRKPGHRLPHLVRIAPMPGSDTEQAMAELRSLFDSFVKEQYASAIVVEAISPHRSQLDNELMLQQMAAHVSKHAGKHVLLYIPLDTVEAGLESIVHAADPAIWSGFVIGDAIRGPQGVRVSHDGKLPCIAKLQQIRANAGEAAVLLAAAGVHEPADAIDLMEAGADYVLLHSGFVYSGPGLPKRVNEAIIHHKLAGEPSPAEQPFWQNWGWMCLLGIGMIIGGLIAWFIAANGVLLPYDEAFLGINRDEVDRINGNLLYFMSHDRITLAGTMLSIGILYYQLAKHGLRFGLHWAKTAIWASAGVGFPSFFLYLGYGFFDPIQAAAAAILFPMFLLSLRNNPDRPYRLPVNLRNSKEWKGALWGQLCFVVLGFALCIGGIVIALVGITNVFVPEDISYLCTSRDDLNLANERLIPLIAHDRAGFGGALLSDAVGILVVALWGLQQGAKWQWWTLLLSGAPGFVAGLSIHFIISYTDFWHLLPAYFAFGLYIVGLVMLYPYLMRSGKQGSSKGIKGGRRVGL